MNLYGSASGFSERTNHSLRLRRLNGRLQFLAGARQALAVDHNQPFILCFPFVGELVLVDERVYSPFTAPT